MSSKEGAVNTPLCVSEIKYHVVEYVKEARPQLGRPAVAELPAAALKLSYGSGKRDLINSQFATKRGSDRGDFKMLWEGEKF